MEKNPGYFLLPESVEYIPNVEYATGAGMPLKLDILRPDPMPKNKVPVMIYIHGGGWLGGSYQLLPNLLYILWQSDYKVPVNVLLAANGFFTVTIQYRKSFEAIFPAQIEDCKAAVRWVRAHAEEYNLDTEHIGVWGHSAGGHLAALLGTSADVEELEGNGGWGEYSSRVHAVVDCFGPTDFKQFRKGMDDPESPPARLIGGIIRENPDKVDRANPINYIKDSDVPPFLIIHGNTDKSVEMRQSELLYEALKKAEADVTFIPVKNAGHSFKGDHVIPGREEINRLIMEFFNRHLKR